MSRGADKNSGHMMANSSSNNNDNDNRQNEGFYIRLYPVKKFLLHSTTAIRLMSSSASMVEEPQDYKKIWERRE